MSRPVPLRALIAPTLLTLLSGSAGATGLRVQNSPVLPGTPALTDARWDTRGGIHLCLGERLLSLGPDGEPRGVLLGGPCRALSVSPDRTSAVTLNGDQLTVVDLASHRVTGRLAVPGLSGAGFRSDGTLLLGSPQGLESVHLPDLTRQTLDPEPVTALSVHADGLRLVLVRGARIQLLDATSLQVLSGTSCDATCLAGPVNFSADGRSAAVQSAGTLLALREGYPATTVLRASDPETRSAFRGLPLRDNTVLLLREAEVQVRDIQTGHREVTRAQPGLHAVPATLSTTEQVLSLYGPVLQVSAADLSGARPLLRLPGRVRAGAVDTAGTLITLTQDGTLSARPGTRALGLQGASKSAYALTTTGLLELRPGAPRALPGQSGATALSVNHWGTQVATWSASGLSVTAQKTGKVVFTAPLRNLTSVTVTPDGTRAYVFPARGEPGVILFTGKRSPLPTQPGVQYRDVQISGKGQFAYARADGRIDLYQSGRRQPVATLPGGGPARFSPDSTLLALTTSTPSGWVVTLHDPQSGKELARSGLLDGAPSFLAWRADSRQLHVGAGPLDGLGSVTSFTVTP